MKILVLIFVLAMLSIVPYQIKAFGEVSTIVPPQTTINVNGTDFTILYSITGGKITSIQANTDSKTIDVNVQPSDAGSVTITLPTKLIDAYQGDSETHFMVLSNNHGVHYTEIENFLVAENRTLTISFTNTTSTIEIKGTYMAPEFGSVAPVILVLAIIAVVMFSKNHFKL